MATITRNNRPRRPLEALLGRLMLGLAISLPLVVSACKTTMSIEEARKVTAAFSDRPFVPPPRTIEDITAILDQQKPADPRAAAEARARADRQPPNTDNAATLAEFYYERASAARHIGRGKQEIIDLTSAAVIDEGGFVDPVTNRLVFSYAHPIFWAPFTLVGDGG